MYKVTKLIADALKAVGETTKMVVEAKQKLDTQKSEYWL